MLTKSFFLGPMFFLSVFGVGADCEFFVSCELKSGCGSIDYEIEKDLTVHAHFDSCARGGYGSHPVAVYEIAGSGDNKYLEISRRFDENARAEIRLGKCLSRDICELPN